MFLWCTNVFVFCVCRKRMAATELSKSMNEFLTKLQDDLKEAMNTMMCTKCEGKHKCVWLTLSSQSCSFIQASVLCYILALLCSPEHGLFPRRFEMDREPGEARFCAECNKWHSAEEGDLWAESSMLGLRITYFAFMDGKVFDITGSLLASTPSDICMMFICCMHMLNACPHVHTEWAGCQRISISPDTHRVPYHISFGSKGSSSASRHR